MHREKLVEAGLKRWEIGEIASRIGQLYHTFYLRTSDAHFLREAFVFYDAVRRRSYFADCHESPALAVKELRYHARMIAQCVHLDRPDAARDAAASFRASADRYVQTHRGVADAAEWHTMVEEADAFIAAESAPPLHRSERRRHLRVVDDGEGERAPHAARGGRGGAVGLKLGGAVLCGHSTSQVTFGGLHLDAHRMARACEWGEQSSGDASADRGGGGAGPASDSAAASDDTGTLDSRSVGSGERKRHVRAVSSGSAGESGSIPEDWSSAASVRSPSGLSAALRGAGFGARENPRKTVLSDPSASRLLSVIATAAEELPPRSALLVYVSARRGGGPPRGGVRLRDGGDGGAEKRAQGGGWAAAAAKEEGSASRRNGVPLEPDAALYPSDLAPFTRRPMLLVVDGDDARQFCAAAEPGASVPGGETPAVLCAPPAPPPRAPPGRTSGAFFTAFLSSPLAGMCALCGPTVTAQMGDNADAADRFSRAAAEVEREILDALGEDDAETHLGWARLLRGGDPFLQRFIARFIMCRAMIAMHKTTRGEDAHVPTAAPPLPDCVNAAKCTPWILKIAKAAGCEREFAAPQTAPERAR